MIPHFAPSVHGLALFRLPLMTLATTADGQIHLGASNKQ